MANPSVTYTFSNGTTADATQVNTNFSDLISSLTDGTKSLSIDALTVAGTATLNGNVTLGNSSSDDLTVTASLASSIPIKTTETYDIGSATLGLAGVYLGGNTETVRVIASAAATATWTLTLPQDAGTANYVLQNTGSGVTKWVPIDRNTFDMQNIAVACSVGSSALTIALKGHDGNDLSSTNRGYVSFRDATAATGTPNVRELTGAASLVISSGSTLGHADATDQYIYVYLMDNAGTVVLGASSVLFDEGTVQSSSAEGGAGAADDVGTIYTSSGLASKPIRLIARLKSNQTTAGTWAAVPTEISPPPFERESVGFLATRSSTNQTISSASPTTVVFNSTTATARNYDTHNSFNTSTGVYTVPKTGFWSFSTGLSMGSFTTSEVGAFYMRLDGSSYVAFIKFSQPTTSPVIAMSSPKMFLTKGQTIEVQIDSTADTSYVIGAAYNSFLSGVWEGTTP